MSRKNAPRFLSLATYPTLIPRHGGQKRTFAIRRGFELAGYATYSASMSNEAGYPPDERGELDVVASAATAAEIRSFPAAEAILLARGLEKETPERMAISKILQGIRPDVISFEGPYLFAPLRSLVREHAPNAKIINSTHNQEAVLLERMLETTPHSSAMVDQLREAETELALSADVSFAVSHEDFQYLDNLGAKRIVLFPNGIDAPHIDRRATSRTNSSLRDNFISKYALFVGSLHKPNIDGFVSLISSSLAAIRPGHAVVVAGGSGPAILQQTKSNDERAFGLFSRKVVVLGPVAEGDLGAWLDGASLIVLPILSGAGTNLKTAEALLSGKRILATDRSFLGFEKWKTDPRVTLCNDPAEFSRQIERLLSLPEQLFPPVVDVTWDTNIPIVVETAKSLWPTKSLDGEDSDAERTPIR